MLELLWIQILLLLNKISAWVFYIRFKVSILIDYVISWTDNTFK